MVTFRVLILSPYFVRDPDCRSCCTCDSSTCTYMYIYRHLNESSEPWASRVEMNVMFIGYKHCFRAVVTDCEVPGCFLDAQVVYTML